MMFKIGDKLSVVDDYIVNDSKCETSTNLNRQVVTITETRSIPWIEIEYTDKIGKIKKCNILCNSHFYDVFKPFYTCSKPKHTPKYRLVIDFDESVNSSALAVDDALKTLVRSAAGYKCVSAIHMIPKIEMESWGEA